MKAPLLPILLLTALTALADPARQMAYGRVNFGDSLEVAEASMKKDLDEMNRRREAADAKDVVHKFVFNGTKYPAKLAPKYSKTMVGMQLAKFPVTTVSVRSNLTPAAQYNTTVKQDWEVLQDIAASKFGPQKTNLGFPAEPADGKPQEVVTDVWEYSNLVIRLAVHPFREAPGQMKYSVALTASLKEANQ